MLIERDPLTLTVVLLGYWWLVTLSYSWHVIMTWHFDILIDILTCVSLTIWLPQGLSKKVSHCQKLKDLLFISWLMTKRKEKKENLSFTSSLSTYFLRVFLLIEKRNWAFDLWKKSLERTLSFSNWVLNIKEKSHAYCFILSRHCVTFS